MADVAGGDYSIERKGLEYVRLRCFLSMKATMWLDWKGARTVAAEIAGAPRAWSGGPTCEKSSSTHSSAPTIIFSISSLRHRPRAAHSLLSHAAMCVPASWTLFASPFL